MFTGLVESVGRVQSFQPSELKENCRRLAIAVTSNTFPETNVGDSVALNGCCLTVVAVEGRQIDFEVSKETLSLTNLSLLSSHTLVNLEWAMLANGRLGGHFVLGHVDGLADLKEFAPHQQGRDLIVQLHRELSRYVVRKGSICLDGISLTVNDMTDFEDHTLIRLTIIPETLRKTHLESLSTEWQFNCEVDVLAKHLERLQQRR